MGEARNPLWSRLLQWAVPEEWGASVLGDLQEELRRRTQQQAAWRARIWIWAHTAEVAGQFVLYRLRQRLLARRQEFSPVGRRKGDGFMRGFLQDLRFGLRILFKTPGFTLLAALTLALGIGANSTIFTVVNTVLLRPLPMAEPDRLMYVRENNLKKGWDSFSVSPPNFVDWRAQSRSFSAMAALDAGSYNYTSGAVPEQLSGREVTERFLSNAGRPPDAGPVARVE